MQSEDDLKLSLKRLNRFSRIMETQWRIPFTKIRFGLDFLIGLVPVVGDVLTGLLSLWLIKESLRYQLPKRIYIKMVLNVLLDVLVGSIPLLGDFFDLMFKANRRNLKLVIEHLESSK
ncbi:DUF4112 domain-containing protein [Litoribrevibacter albus]|nr:DUF4112 domain-containing protein [Litoribrevibacter albus]